MTVIIVNYNTREHLRVCLASLMPEALPGEVIVIDNASTDGSVEMIQTHFPQVVVHASKTNLGFGQAANLAITSSSSSSINAEYLLLLNSDTVLPPGALQALSDYLDRYPRVAIAGPRLLNSDGTVQFSCRRFPGTLWWLFDNQVMSHLIRHLPIFRNYSLRTWPHDDERAVPWVLGAAMAIRRKAFKEVSGFDESFFMFCEDIDLCYRLRSAGWEIRFTPVTTIAHVGGASTRQRRAEMAIQLVASNLRFYRLHYSGLRLGGLVMLAKSKVALKLARDVIRWGLARDYETRRRMAEDVAAWRRCLRGRKILTVKDREGQHNSELMA